MAKVVDQERLAYSAEREGSDTSVNSGKYANTASKNVFECYCKILAELYNSCGGNDSNINGKDARPQQNYMSRYFCARGHRMLKALSAEHSRSVED